MLKTVSRDVSTDGYLPALDGLRGLSVALVVISHFGLGHWVPGGLGVTIFFFISGFIITRLMLREFQTKSITYQAFYIRRFFRLAPALLVFVMLSNIFMRLLDQPIPWLDNLSAVFYFANYWEIYFGWGGLPAESYHSPLSVLWSLAVEEHFYLVFPVLLAVLQRRSQWPLAWLGGAVLAILTWRMYLALDYLVLGNSIQDSQTYRTFKATDTRIDSILFGCMLSVAMENQWKSPRLTRVMDRISGTGGLCTGLALMVLTLALRDVYFRETLRYSLQGLALYLIFSTTFAGQGLASRIVNSCLAARVPVYLGKISYSLYLYHWLVRVAFFNWFPQSTPLMQLAMGIPLSLALSIVSWRWVETPFRRIGHAWAARATAAHLATHHGA